MENKNVLTISDITAAILNGEMTTADAADMFEKQLNASIEAAMEKEAKKVQEENLNKSAVKVVKAVFDFIVTAYPDLIPNDFIFTDKMANEAANELKDFTKEIIDTLPTGIFEAVKYLNNGNESVDTVKKPQKTKTVEVKNFDELLDVLAETGIFSVKPTCEYENLKKYNNVKKEDNISKFLREIGL